MQRVKRIAGAAIWLGMVGLVGLIALTAIVVLIIDAVEGRWAEVAASLFMLALVLSIGPVLSFATRLIYDEEGDADE